MRPEGFGRPRVPGDLDRLLRGISLAPRPVDPFQAGKRAPTVQVRRETDKASGCLDSQARTGRGRAKSRNARDYFAPEFERQSGQT